MLTKYQLKRLLDLAYSWAQFRTFAGVHYAEDNILGLLANGLDKYMRSEVKSKYRR